MDKLHEFLNNKVSVKNAVNSLDNTTNWIEYYFREKYKIAPPTSWKCLSCGKQIFLKKTSEDIKDNDVMVGGHVVFIATGSEFILPICKECNDRKENLPPFKVEFCKLCPLKQLSPFFINISINKSDIAIYISYVTWINISHCKFSVAESTIAFISKFPHFFVDSRKMYSCPFLR